MTSRRTVAAGDVGDQASSTFWPLTASVAPSSRLGAFHDEPADGGGDAMAPRTATGVPKDAHSPETCSAYGTS